MADVIALVPDEEQEETPRRPINRDADLLGRRVPEGQSPKSGIRHKLDRLFTQISEGFKAQEDRADETQDYWDCYNCEANQNRYYNGIADIYVPLIHDAVEAQVTRQTNQLFPQGGRYVQAISSDGSTNNALVALLDHYIRNAEMATQVVEPLVRNGQIEGQYNLYIDWSEVERLLVSRETHGPIDPQTGQEMPGPEIEDINEKLVIEGNPVYEVLHDEDVLVLPQSADSVDEALAADGCAVVVRRWNGAKIDAMARAGNIREDECGRLKELMEGSNAEQRDIERHLLEQVGIIDKGEKAQVWEVWTMLHYDDETGRYSDKAPRRLCRIFMGPNRSMLGAKRNPYWNDRCPLLSRPVKKISGNFKGPAPVRYVESLQYEANDAVNEGADAATLSAAPIVARDPEKNNGPLVYNVGAVWDIPPGSVELLTFPDLTPRAATRVQMATAGIMQNLGVNPSMLPQQVRDSKPNQAQVAQDQAVDLLTTDMATRALENLLTDAMAWTVDLDYQFRDYDLTVRMYGEEGKQAEMQAVAPLQNRAGFTFVWRGGEQVRQNAMFAQQGAQLLNVLQNPAIEQRLKAEGKQLRLSYIVTQMVSNAFGPYVGSLTIVDQRDNLTIPQDEENQWLLDGYEVPVHPLDDDKMHLQHLMPAIQESGDPHGTLRVHAQQHFAQMQAKNQAQMMQAMQQNLGGVPGPGGGPRPPGQQPGPPPGAMPAGPRALKGPPGGVHPDQMARAGGIAFPRKY